MKSILKDTNNSEKLLNMVSDTLILMDKDGVCVDMAVHNVDLWFMNEERLLGKNLLNLLPPVTYSEFYPEFKKVLLRRTKSVRNYELMLRDDTYFFKCIMQPYGDLVLCQYRDITERSQRKLELERRNRELYDVPALYQLTILLSTGIKYKNSCHYQLAHILVQPIYIE